MTQPTIDSEVEEMLLTAFVGMWVRDEEGNFVSLDDKYGVLKDHLKQEITNLIAQEAKAFGGCRICYGKGYATVISGTKGYADFGGDGFQTPPTTHIKYCSCDRGKQLQQVVAQEANKARLETMQKVSDRLDDLHQGTEGGGWVHYGEMGEWLDDEIKELTADKEPKQ